MAVQGPARAKGLEPDVVSKADQDYAFGLYPDGKEVLRNKLNIRDQEQLKETEYALTRVRTNTAPPFPPTQKGYLDLHRHLFGELYDWAGQHRTVDMSKNGLQFGSARFLDATMATIFADLAQEDFLRGRTGERFAAGAAHHISELNAAHPFREGNGRAMRLQLQQLAEQAGHSIDVLRIPGKEWMAASTRGFEGDERPMTAVIAGALRPARLLTPDAAIAELRDAVAPARREILEATRGVRDQLGTSRTAATLIERFRGELAELGRTDIAIEHLTDARGTPGLLPVNAPASAAALDRAQAILGAISRLPSSLVVPASGNDPTAPSQTETQAAYQQRTTVTPPAAGGPAPAAPTGAASTNPAAAAPDVPAAAPARPGRPSRDPGPGF